ncbi:neuroguidin [Trichogramma pretiosum]|uniref:neuroguidin n=1 Tax=Trichogramma pretiosum TaxID=7493 RepID=UPI0006C998E3|nr:neuroguidin [Trichogramma pretiosum]
MVQAIDEMEQRDLPQALSLLGEMNKNVEEVNALVENMLKRVKNGEITTDKGLNFLEMKYQMLLSYLINLTHIVLRKCSGEKIEDHPSIDRLIEIKTVLVKIKPIEQNFNKQIEKFVKTAATGTRDSDDPINFKPNPNALIGKLDDSDEESESDDEIKEAGPKPKKSGIYVPPKLAAVHYDGDVSAADKTRRAEERARRRAVSGTVLQELKEEFLDAPIEDSADISEKQSSFGRENKRKIEYEETYMTRLPVTKAEKHRQRQMTTLGTLGTEITSFGSGPSGKKRKAKGKGKSKKSFKKKRHH